MFCERGLKIHLVLALRLISIVIDVPRYSVASSAPCESGHRHQCCDSLVVRNRKGEHFRSSHREFFHINIDKYSALYLASKASAFLLYLFIYLLYNNRAINSNLQGSIEKEINYET